MKYNVVGINRSGAVYLSKLIKVNFNSTEYNQLGDTKEHHNIFGNQSINQKDVFHPTFIIYKSIYHWIESVAIRQPKIGEIIIKNLKYDESRYIHTSPDITVGDSKLHLNKLVNIYRQYYENWILNMSEHNKSYAFVVNYTHLINKDNRLNTLSKINDYFTFLKNDDYINVGNTIPLSLERFRHMGEFKNVDNHQITVYEYYTNKPKGLFLTEEHIGVIDEIIDPTFKNLIHTNTNSIV